ncbi:MAG TPA: helix-turn-helix domain-containing protein [Anaerolineales bacterium]
MTKFTRTERLTAALAVEAGDSQASVGRRFGMSEAIVRRSVRLYREQGETGFLAKKAHYTVAQKLEVIRTRHTQSLSLEEAAVKFGINGSATIWEWERRYLENGIDGLKPKKKGRRPRVRKPKVPPTPYEQLLAENEYLRAENEYLKKLNALVAEREAREKHDGATE